MEAAQHHTYAQAAGQVVAGTQRCRLHRDCSWPPHLLGCCAPCACAGAWRGRPCTQTSSELPLLVLMLLIGPQACVHACRSAPMHCC